MLSVVEFPLLFSFFVFLDLVLNYLLDDSNIVLALELMNWVALICLFGGIL